jgi:putative mRNA 3-end processing factor
MLQFTEKGIYCTPGDFYIDPWRPVDRAVITHGHADHARWGMKHYLCQDLSVPILKSRIGADISVEGLPYETPTYLNGVKVSLHPAGHIIGAAQIRMEYKGKVTVVSGDYKRQEDGISTPFEVVRCHEFITESTFGLPIYQWKPVAEQNQQLQDWVHKNQLQGKTSIFVAYSLGKAQRIMKAVQGAGEVFVHYSIARLNSAYESAGIHLPPYTPIDLRENPSSTDRGIVIVPPALVDSQVIRKIPHSSVAICSGWMQVRGARRWRSADAGFAISDHADWNDLLLTVRETGAEKVFVTHGQTAVFARYLNEIGISASEVKTEFGAEEEPETNARAV